jgi:hypothetical protein
MITKKDLDEILKNLDEDAKLSFLNMPREDQLTVLLAMEGSNSNRLAKVEKSQVEFNQDLERFKFELREVRARREKKEEGQDDLLSITERMIKVYEDRKAQEFDAWVYTRDKVLPTFFSTALLALIVLMGLFISGRLP